MITLHILQLLSDEGFGTIDVDLFYEDLPSNGVGIFSRGGPTTRGKQKVQAFDLYSRADSRLAAADKLEKIQEYFDDEFVVCDLPVVPNKSNKVYRQARIIAVANVENLGKDETDRLVFRLSCEVRYKKV